MYAHFSDWSMFLGSLDEKGVPRGDNIIKVYVCGEDPRKILNKPDLFIMELSDAPFTEDEVFTYQDRGSYSGPELEQKLSSLGINEAAKRHARALFRFANLPEIQSCPFMMSLKNPDGSYMFSHPFDDIDGIDMAIVNPERRSNSLHIDIFSKETLAKLKKIFNYDQKELLVPYGREILRLIMPERNLVLEGTSKRVELG